MNPAPRKSKTPPETQPDDALPAEPTEGGAPLQINDPAPTPASETTPAPAGSESEDQASTPSLPASETATALAWRLLRSACVGRDQLPLAQALNLAAGRWGAGLASISLSGETLMLESQTGALSALALSSHGDLEQVTHEISRIAGDSEFPDPGRVALRGEESLNAANTAVIRALHTHAATYRTAPLASGKNAQVVFWGDEGGRWCEVTARPGGELSTSAAELQSDAAWTALSRIKNRSLRAELLRKSEQGGMIRALLSARRSGIEDEVLARPEAVLAPLRVILEHGDESPQAIATRGAQELTALQAQAAAQLADLIMSTQPGEE